MIPRIQLPGRTPIPTPQTGKTPAAAPRYRAPADKMHKTKCSNCKTEFEVPFKPVPGRSVHCRQCLLEKRTSRF